MKIDVLTLFPEMLEAPLQVSLLKKAQEKALLKISVTNIRDFTSDKHKTADDAPFGGGAGMVIKAEPVVLAIEAARGKDKVKSRPLRLAKHGGRAKVLLTAPSGKKFDQAKAKELSREKHLIIICGHYEGIDQRVRDEYIDEEISIGDFVLTGGELPALVIIDTVARMIPGVVKENDSLVNDSFYAGLLDFPSYTRPEEFRGKAIPAVLKSGNHNEISRWRRKQSLALTLFERPDLLASAGLEDTDKKLLEEIIKE